ncbi:MAG: Ig-like domain-containing protein [Candidatus Riflebacteria bacterium]|nr:Ig-like domain-containing protein [Candidatus Riflebacteria bacterium]
MREFKTWSYYFVWTLIMSFFLITGCRGCREDSGQFAEQGALPAALTVTSTNPESGESDVAVNKKISVTFSEEMAPSTISSATFRLASSDGITVAGTLSYAGLSAVFAPSGDLAVNTVYSATVTTGAKGLAGNSLSTDFTWSFTTGSAPDTVAPTVVSTDPEDHAVDVAVNMKITVPFSKAMDPLTVNSTTFTLVESNDAQVANLLENPKNFSLAGSAGQAIQGTVVCVGWVAVFTPAKNLSLNTRYIAMLSTGVKDLAGNALAENYIWSFTAIAPDPVPPTVAFTDPANGDIDVAINKKIAVTFSKAIDPLTINPKTVFIDGVSGTVLYDAVTKIATFKSNTDLSIKTAYIITVTTGVKDLAGNAMAANFTSPFTTGVARDITAPTVSSTDPVENETNVAVNKKISVPFSESMNPLTINNSNFYVTDPNGAKVVGTVSYAGLVAIFKPVSNFAFNTRYSAVITTGAKDLAGNGLAGNYNWSFTTGSLADIIAPTVVTTSTIPTDGATNVPVNIKLSVAFSEGMNPLTMNLSNIYLKGPGGTTVTGTVTYLGVTAIFTPAANLAFNATYTGTVTTGAKDLAGNTMAANYNWSFVTGATPDTTRPSVVSTDPLTGSKNVAVSKKLSVTFSEAMNPLTVSPTTFTLARADGTSVTGTVSLLARIATFTPTVSLISNATYTATITTGAKDLAGNTIAANYTWTFVAGVAPDTVLPSVTSTDPSNSEKNVAVNKKIAVTFSEVMSSATVNLTNYTLSDSSGTAVAGTVSYVGLIANFNPASNLAFNSTYTAMIKTGVKDLAGNALAANYTWSFSTGVAPDTTLPTVTSTDPVNAETNVAVNKKIAVTFSEGMDSATINSSTFTVAGPGGTLVAGTVTNVGVVAYFTPSSNLPFNSTYTATITTGAKDLAGNALGSNYTWTFSTGVAPDTTAPVVAAADPLLAATVVVTNKKLSATFSEGMDAATINSTTFVVTGPGGVAVAGTVNYSGLTAIFTPNADLAFLSTYTAKITTGAKDLAGNALAADYIWSFTTGAAPDTTRPTVASSSPANAERYVSIRKKLSAVFNEGMDVTTINSTTFSVTGPGGTAVTGTVACVGTIATFSPTINLALNSTYTATINTSVKDLAGNALAANYIWSFSTDAPLDIIPPVVSSSDPSNGEKDVALNKKIAVTFSESMASATINSTNFTITGPGGIAVTGAVNYVGMVANFTPTGNLTANATYTGTITTGVKDVAGNALAANYTWTFITGAAADTTAPTVASIDPVDAEKEVAVNKKISVTFSESMDSATISSASFKVADAGGVPVAGTVTFAGMIANFTPTSVLAFNATFTVTVTTGVKDLAENALAANYTSTFTTGAAPDTTAPTVASTDPANAEKEVAVNKKIAAPFSESMDSETINPTTFKLTGPGGTPVAGTVTYVGQIANFAPLANLSFNATYTALISTGVCDLAGNEMETAYTWSFTTGAAPDTTPPTVSSTDPVNNETDVAVNKKIAAVFSEGMDSATINQANFKLTGPGGSSVSGLVNYVGMIANFTPTANLAFNTTYTARIATGAKDLAGNAIAASYSWSFTTGNAPDTTKPTVASTDPANAEKDVAVNKKISATFSEGMDSATINQTTFKLKGPGGTTVTGTVTNVGMIANFTPAANLAFNSTYTASIATGAKDLAGNTIAASYSWNFTTGAAPDTTPPTVISTDPASGAVDVPVNKKISAPFSEGMDSSTINQTTFKMKGPGGISIPGTVSYAGMIANFAPTANYAFNATYTVTITTGAKDLAGNPLGADYVWSFTTGDAPDTTRPTVASTDPANKEGDVAVNKKIAVSFSEGMDSSTINQTTFKLAGPGGTSVSGTVSYAGTIANFTPLSNLAFNATYTANIATGAKDLSGNSIAASYTWTFLTGAAPDTTAPVVVSADPAKNEIEVAVNKKIAVTFSESMDTATINLTTFKLTGPGGTSVTGTVSYAGLIANFTPTTNLAFNATYTAVVATGVKDLAGNTLTASYSWSFTTGAAPDTTRPTVASTDPANNEIAVAVNKKIAATFSEGMDSSTINQTTFKLTGPGGTSVTGTVSYAGLIANFTPTTNLAFNATYTANIATGAKDLSGNAIAASYTWTFLTGAAPDTTAPLVVSADPANNEKEVAVNKKIAVTFSEGMDSATINLTTLKLTGPGGTSVTGTVSYAGLIANFTPTTNLAFNATYTAVVATGAKDLAGNALTASYTWSFTTGAAPDTTPPTVTAKAPLNNERNVSISSKIVASFSEGMDSLTINPTTFSLTGPGGISVSGTVNYAGLTATFTPSVNLAYNATYTAVIATGAKDLAGNKLAASFSWSFTTGAVPDTTPPTVVYVAPASGAIEVAVNRKPVASFSEDMDPATINQTTFKMIASDGTNVIGSVTYSASVATFTPTNNLAFNSSYTVIISSGAKDLAGNRLTASYSWTFVTAVRPTVVSTNPASNATDVPINKKLLVTFSKDMNADTITNLSFTVAGVAGTVTYDSVTRIATFKPTANYAINAPYTAVISSGVKDLAGNALEKDYSWTFTTGLRTLAEPVALGAVEAFGNFGGGAGMTNQGLLTVVNGDIGTTGVSTMITGFHDTAGNVYTETTLNKGKVNGIIHSATAPPGSVAGVIAANCDLDARSAFDKLSPDLLPGGIDVSAYGGGAGQLGNRTLLPGIYKSAPGTYAIQDGPLTLDAQGDANAVWVFQMASSLTVGGPGAAFPQSVILVNGALAKNVYWQVGSAATINAGGGGTMVGTIIARAGATFSTAGNVNIVTLNGRAIGLDASVTIVNTVINVPE